jgi:outer membrane protein OmpA-like peptidoglycan-associated protein
VKSRVLAALYRQLTLLGDDAAESTLKKVITLWLAAYKGKTKDMPVGEHVEFDALKNPQQEGDGEKFPPAATAAADAEEVEEPPVDVQADSAKGGKDAKKKKREKEEEAPAPAEEEEAAPASPSSAKRVLFSFAKLSLTNVS